MKAVKSNWLAFAIMAALAGGCGDSAASNDGDGTGGTNNTGNNGDKDDGGNGGGEGGDGATGSGNLPAASECGALADGSGPLDTSKNGGCYYFYCYQTEATLRAAATPGGACAGAKDVAQQCEGDPPMVVAECARANPDSVADATAFAKAITECAKPKLAGFSDACLACNVESAVCAGRVTNCLTLCLSKDTPECDACRQAKGCTPEFYKCAGLPDPMAP